MAFQFDAETFSEVRWFLFRVMRAVNVHGPGGGQKL